LDCKKKGVYDDVDDGWCISHSFIALVHGQPPDEWKEGVELNLPTNGARHWRHKSISTDYNLPTDTEDMNNEELASGNINVNIMRNPQLHPIDGIANPLSPMCSF